MSNSITHALPYPIRKARFALPVAFRVSAGTPTDPTTPDTEFSTDGGASFSDTAEEITTGGANGAGYLTLTGAETDNPILWIAAKSANCLTTPVLVTPRNLAIVGSGTLSAGSAGGGTLGTLLAYDVTGCFIRTTGGTGGGGTGGANNQARRIITYSTSTGAFTVSPNWETTPSTDTTYDVLLPEGVTLGMLKTLNPATAGRTLVVDASGLADANMVKAGPSGSGTAQTAGDLAALINTLTGYVDTEVAAILAAVDTEIATIVTQTTAASIRSAVGLASANLDTQLSSIASAVAASAIRSALGMSSANLDTQLATIAGYIDTEVAAILSAVDTEISAIISTLGSAGAGLSAIPWNASWDAEVQSEVDDALKAALTEGYRSTNSTGSVRDLLYEIIAHLGESSIISTTKTLKKIDGSTTAKTYTLDSATTPTSITETT